MSGDALIDELHAMLGIVLLMALPPLIGAMLVGLAIGILQAVTQVQDQSLPVAFKLLVVILVMVLVGPLLVAPLVRFAGEVFDGFPSMSQ